MMDVKQTVDNNGGSGTGTPVSPTSNDSSSNSVNQHRQLSVGSVSNRPIIRQEDQDSFGYQVGEDENDDDYDYENNNIENPEIENTNSNTNLLANNSTSILDRSLSNASLVNNNRSNSNNGVISLLNTPSVSEYVDFSLNGNINAKQKNSSNLISFVENDNKNTKNSNLNVNVNNNIDINNNHVDNIQTPNPTTIITSASTNTSETNLNTIDAKSPLNLNPLINTNLNKNTPNKSSAAIPFNNVRSPLVSPSVDSVNSPFSMNNTPKNRIPSNTEDQSNTEYQTFSKLLSNNGLNNNGTNNRTGNGIGINNYNPDFFQDERLSGFALLMSKFYDPDDYSQFNKYLWSRVRYYIPSIGWIPNYKKNFLKYDILAGLSVASVVIPQSLSYAQALVGVDPIQGLLTASFPLITYSMLGTSKQLAIGPEALISILVGSAVKQYTPNEEPLTENLSNNLMSRASIVFTLALMVSAINFLLGFCRLGFLDNVLSRPLLRGFILAVALVVMIDMSDSLLGISITLSENRPSVMDLLSRIPFIGGFFGNTNNYDSIDYISIRNITKPPPSIVPNDPSLDENTEGSPFDTLIYILSNLRYIHLPTALLSFVSISFLLIIQRFKIFGKANYDVMITRKEKLSNRLIGEIEIAKENMVPYSDSFLHLTLNAFNYKINQLFFNIKYGFIYIFTGKDFSNINNRTGIPLINEEFENNQLSNNSNYYSNYNNRNNSNIRNHNDNLNISTNNKNHHHHNYNSTLQKKPKFDTNPKFNSDEGKNQISTSPRPYSITSSILSSTSLTTGISSSESGDSENEQYLSNEDDNDLNGGNNIDSDNLHSNKKNRDMIKSKLFNKNKNVQKSLNSSPKDLSNISSSYNNNKSIMNNSINEETFNDNNLNSDTIDNQSTILYNKNNDQLDNQSGYQDFGHSFMIDTDNDEQQALLPPGSSHTKFAGSTILIDDNDDDDNNKSKNKVLNIDNLIGDVGDDVISQISQTNISNIEGNSFLDSNIFDDKGSGNNNINNNNNPNNEVDNYEIDPDSDLAFLNSNDRLNETLYRYYLIKLKVFLLILLDNIPEILVLVIVATVLSKHFDWPSMGIQILGHGNNDNKEDNIDEFYLNHVYEDKKWNLLSFLKWFEFNNYSSSDDNSLTKYFHWSFPVFSMKRVSKLMLPAILISVIGFVESIAVAKTYAGKLNYSVSPNRELVAYGASNLVGGMLGAWPAFGSLGRSAVNYSVGAKTQLSGLITGLVVVITAIFFLPFFFDLPKAVCSAIIVVAALKLIELDELFFMIKLNAWTDIGLMLMTFLSTIVISIETGTFLSVGVSLLLVVKHTTRLRLAVLDGHEEYDPITETYKFTYRIVSRYHPGISTLIVKIEEGLFFGNCGGLKERLRRLELLGGLDIHPGEDPITAIVPTNINNIDNVQPIQIQNNNNYNTNNNNNNSIINIESPFAYGTNTVHGSPSNLNYSKLNKNQAKLNINVTGNNNDTNGQTISTPLFISSTPLIPNLPSISSQENLSSLAQPNTAHINVHNKPSSSRSRVSTVDASSQKNQQLTENNDGLPPLLPQNSIRNKNKQLSVIESENIRLGSSINNGNNLSLLSPLPNQRTPQSIVFDNQSMISQPIGIGINNSMIDSIKEDDIDDDIDIDFERNFLNRNTHVNGIHNNNNNSLNPFRNYLNRKHLNNNSINQDSLNNNTLNGNNINNEVQEYQGLRLDSIIFDFSGVTGVDASAALTLLEIIENYESRGIHVFICKIRPESRRVLRKAGILSILGENANYLRVRDAVQAALHGNQNNVA